MSIVGVCRLAKQNVWNSLKSSLIYLYQFVDVDNVRAVHHKHCQLDSFAFSLSTGTKTMHLMNFDIF